MGSTTNISDCYICGTGTATACKSEYCQDMHQMLMKSGNPAAKKLLEGFDAEGNICIMCNKGGGIPNPATGEPVCFMCALGHKYRKILGDLRNTPKTEEELENHNNNVKKWEDAVATYNPDDYDAEEFEAPTGYNESGPRPFYGNRRKMALDRWGNRRFIRRRKDGTYMKNVDVNRSLAMDRRRKSTTWAPAGFRDQGDGSPSLLIRLLDMFKGVDEVVLMAESDLMCAGCDDYSSECGCHNSESDAYIYAYNDGHTDARNQSGYKPTTSDREITSFKKIFKQQ
jgi:hypothetical protein